MSQWSTPTKVAAITAAGVVLAACVTGAVSLITALGNKPPAVTPPAVVETVSSPACLVGTWEMAKGAADKARVCYYRGAHAT